MKFPFLFCVLITSSLYAQKFAIIENKGDNAKHFDYANHNSFVGILMNNLSIIPSMVVHNDFQGVYTESMLTELGIKKESMLEFSLNPKLSIYRPNSEDTMDIIRTDQTLDVFLDSVKSDLDYEMLFNIDRNKLSTYWNKANVNSPVRIHSSYYFDLRDLSALLLEQKDSITWVHFVKSNTNGKNFVCLSLTYDQIKETDCFIYWKLLSDEEGKQVIESYKQQCLNQKNDDYFREWINGNFQKMWGIDLQPAYFSESYCSSKLGYENGLYGNRTYDTYHPLDTKLTPLSNLSIDSETQKRGELLSIYRTYSEDTMNVIKTKQSLQIYLDSLRPDYDYEELMGIDFESLNKWWNQTKIGDQVRKSPEEIIFWAESPNTRVAVTYYLKSDGTPFVLIDNVYFYEQVGSKKLSYMQYSTNDDYNDESPIRLALKKIDIDVKTPNTWHSILQKEMKSIKYSKIKAKLNLLNDQTEF
jgi:hypothetical protein